LDQKIILLVEDDEAIRSSIAQVLEFENYKIIEAENGQVALDILKELPPNELPGLILLDMMMPIMDGKTFLENVKAHHLDSFGKIPIIIASANTNFPNEIDLPLVVERLKKPFDLDDLISKVEKYYSPS